MSSTTCVLFTHILQKTLKSNQGEEKQRKKYRQTREWGKERNLKVRKNIGRRSD
jgi:hypothetical protein